MDWKSDVEGIDWGELSNLYRIAPLRYICFLFESGQLIGAGRALADGIDCSYLCDVAVHPEYESRGIGTAIIARLKELSAGHRKIILYANPGKEPFYRKLGFRRMRTAMAIFRNQEHAIASGLVEKD